MMKGLEEYIEKHGKHFTEQLAIAISHSIYSPSEIKRTAQKRVYYNVTGSTLGDMVYLVGMAMDSDLRFSRSKIGCIKFALCVIGDFAFYERTVFVRWIEGMTKENKGFDFTPYI